MKRSKADLKILAFCLCILLTLPLFSSCVQNKTVIGTVEGKDVYYDELYFLVSNYKASVEKEANEDEALMRQELDRLVKENIIKNYAILLLCESYGLQYKDIEDSIDDELEKYISENFGGKKSEFKKSCKEYGLSERYVRFNLGLELLYQQLPQKYAESGKVLTKEEDILAYIKDNFIRVNHLVIFNDLKDNTEDNATKMSEAKALLDGGESIERLIGKGYSEDLLNVSSDGYYITKGTMSEEYENAAFSLKVGEHSDIISSYGVNNSDEYVPCYYIIKRLAASDEYIDKHYEALKDDYYNSVINKELKEIENKIKFEPNEKYAELDPLDLHKPANMTVLIIIPIVFATITGIVVAVIIIKLNLNKKNASYKAKSGRRK